MSEATKQATETQGPQKSWEETAVWTERMLAALANGVKGGKWFSLYDKVYRPEVLMAAWQRVKRNRGAAGVDRVSIDRFDAQAAQCLEELHQTLKTGQYRPQAVKRLEIPKGDGKTRPLGIPTVKDRVVQAALKSVIEPIFERQFLDTSHGFRPGRGCKDALRVVDQGLKEGYCWVVDADIQGYFDNIAHERLMKRVEASISDGNVLTLIRQFLEQDILLEARRWTPMKGTPQGAVLSPLLANLYLHPLDEKLTGEGFRLVRYADDFVILCQSREEAERALESVRVWMAENDLNLHPDKTHIGDCREPGQGFEFLGYRFEAGRRTVRRKSLNKVRDAIRLRTRRTSGESIERTIQKLNPVLKGWFGYFKHAHKYTFNTLDAFVRRRLRAILLKQNKKQGCANSKSASFRWKNAYFAERGLFSLHEAYVMASQSR
ncbi:group II intron reverse transcriptase/maturase [Methylomonas sp. EFPC3]|uniref:group II intron reverse transcriptase/maturase n=1 Tax=Methylomonas sp. EFPC3 TaxID=3021710 RepID=UPI002417E4FD|nr:group II intron reverse transcriptase/maturase [Methylomonas sp. EFPC3]WFP48911.1 group II intron reverse transcriptase/maturase [Methylomonas sp. EFPC3]